MDTLDSYREIVRAMLTEMTRIPYSHGDIRLETVFDRESDRYLVMTVGRDRGARVHGCLVHVDIVDGKLWVQRDGTEHGIANDLVEAGVAKQHIVLGFYSPETRKHAGLAQA